MTGKTISTTRHTFTSLGGDPELLQNDPRFATQQARTQHAEAAGTTSPTAC